MALCKPWGRSLAGRRGMREFSLLGTQGRRHGKAHRGGGRALLSHFLTSLNPCCAQQRQQVTLLSRETRT